MTIAVDWDVKQQYKQTDNNLENATCLCLWYVRMCPNKVEYGNVLSMDSVIHVLA